MRKYCCIKTCKNNNLKTTNEHNTCKVKFYCFPSNNPHMPWLQPKRIDWSNAVKKYAKHPDDWEPGKYALICSAHFVGNEKSEHPSHPSYLPTIFNINTNPKYSMQKLQRWKRQHRAARLEESKSKTTCTMMAPVEAEDRKSKNVNAESNTEFAHSVDTESNFEGQSNVNTESDSEVPDITNTFTWQKSSEVIISDEEDEYLIGTEIDAADLLSSQDNVSTQNDAPAVQGDGAYEAYKCNICSEPIKGFRYRCVQCADYDLCAACEARGAHERHYVLRIPGPRPYTEIQSVLERIRKELMAMNNTVLFEDTHMLDSMKEEVKDELDDPLCEDVTKETYEDERMERMSTTNHSNGDHSGSEQSKDDTDDEEYRPEENENIRVTYTHNVKNARPPNTVPCKPKIKIRNYNSLKRKLSISPTRPTVTNVGNTAQCRETENNDIQGL